MTAHDDLKRCGITPTIDAERAYTLGYGAAMAAVFQDQELRQHLAALGRAEELRRQTSGKPQTPMSTADTPQTRGTTR